MPAEHPQIAIRGPSIRRRGRVDGHAARRPGAQGHAACPTSRTCSRSRRSCSATAAQKPRRSRRCCTTRSKTRGVKPKKIKRRFGGKVARIVRACTETVDGELPTRHGHRRDARRRGWPARPSRWPSSAIPHTPAAVLRVRGADALANARSIVVDLRRDGPVTWQRFHAGAVDQLWYFRSLVDRARRTPAGRPRRRAPGDRARDGADLALVVRRRRPATGRVVTGDPLGR